MVKVALARASYNMPEHFPSDAWDYGLLQNYRYWSKFAVHASPLNGSGEKEIAKSQPELQLDVVFCVREALVGLV